MLIKLNPHITINQVLRWVSSGAQLEQYNCLIYLDIADDNQPLIDTVTWANKEY